MDKEIGLLALAEMYEDDMSADLVITVDGGRYSVTLRSSTQPIILPDAELLTSAGKLVSLHGKYGTRLQSVAYRYEKDSIGSWDWSVVFEYDRR
ncbi:hypothetical protein [Nocardia ignorata]|nr:hypothetical protein [Nocardia ignorata]